MTLKDFNALLIAISLVAPVSVLGQQNQSASGEEKDAGEQLGFTWWNDVPELIERGNNMYSEKVYEQAEENYRAAEFRKPEDPVAALNLGLALAQQGENETAARYFDKALNRAGENAQLREKALYNYGRTKLDLAMSMVEQQQQQVNEEALMSNALDALDAFNETLRLNPNNSDAQRNKTIVQNLIRRQSEPPPPEQQQQQQQQGESGEQQQQQQGQQGEQDQQQEQQQGEQEQEPQEGQQQEEQQGQQNQQQQQGQDQQQGQQQQEPEQGEEQEEQQGGQQPQQQQRPPELSEEQARQLLNLLGDDKNIILRKGQISPNRPKPEKDW